MKKFFTLAIVCACLLIATDSNAQLFRFGVKGGLNFSNIKSFEDFTNVQSIEKYTGWHAGIFLGVKFVVVAIQGDVLYSVEGVRFEDVNNPGNLLDLENSYINIPLVVKFYIVPSKINLHGGVQYGILTNSLIDGKEGYEFDPGTLTTIKDQFKSGGTSVVLGLGVELSKLMVEVRHNLGVSDLSASDLTVEKLKSGVLQLSAGFRFK